MDETALLLVGIEVSVALAGFSGVVATFQDRDAATMARGDVVGLTIIVNFSLMGAFFCALPLILSVFRVDAAAIWSINSALQCVYVLNRMHYVHQNMNTVAWRTSTRRLFRMVQAVSAIVALALALNAAGQVFHREPGPSIAALFFGLGLVGFMFARLLLRPLWRALRLSLLSRVSSIAKFSMLGRAERRHRGRWSHQRRSRTASRIFRIGSPWNVLCGPEAQP
jgi:hypothetical protein